MVRIMIDPGHGGTDPGAVGNGLLEKNLTLDISKQIRDMLLNYKDVDVRLTRERDQTLSLRQRTDLANSWRADFLLSVHINSGGGTGFESFVHPSVGNRTINFQQIIHQEIIKEIDFRDRGMKKADFHMVRESAMDALLTESGFIDRAADAEKLKQPAYIARIARGHVNGLVKAFQLRKKQEESTVEERNQNLVSDWAKQDWEEATRNGYFDGRRPGARMTREEAAIVLNRLRRNFLRLIAENSEQIAELERRLQQIERGS